MNIDIIKQHSNVLPHTKQEVFLCLSAQNLLNKLIKQEKYRCELHYWEIKMSVSALVHNLLDMDEPLYEELAYNNIKECIYIKSYGLQFSFHKVKLDNLTPEQLIRITNNDMEWDRVELQPLAEIFYTFAISLVRIGISDDKEIKNEIQKLIE